MYSKPVSAFAAGLALMATVSQVSAGGKAVACYEQYREPAVYDTVYEDVMVNPASSRIEYVPAIYGTRKRAVVVSPERVTYEVVPAVTQTQYRKVKVADGGYSWEWRVINGRQVLCKMRHKARYELVAETVVVQPEQTRRVIIPAVYDYAVEQVVIQQEQRRVINTPPSYKTVARQVLVSEGATGWQRVRIPGHCQN
jgi:hypothetical protein